MANILSLVHSSVRNASVERKAQVLRKSRNQMDADHVFLGNILLLGRFAKIALLGSTARVINRILSPEAVRIVQMGNTLLQELLNAQNALQEETELVLASLLRRLRLQVIPGQWLANSVRLEHTQEKGKRHAQSVQ